MDTNDLRRKLDSSLYAFSEATKDYTGKDSELAKQASLLFKGFEKAILQYLQEH